MNDGDALLAAILASPDDDAPRLIYADWLSENGDEERGEFIRVQCELAILRNQKDSIGRRIGRRNTPRMLPLVEREGELEAKDLWWLKKEFPILVGYFFPRVWSRGFIHFITLSSDDWLAHGDAILARHPVQEVALTTWPYDLPSGITGIERRRIMASDREQVFGILKTTWPSVKTWRLPHI